MNVSKSSDPERPNTYAGLMYELKNCLERYLRVNLLGPGPRFMKKKKKLPRRGLTKVVKHCLRKFCIRGTPQRKCTLRMRSPLHAPARLVLLPVTY